VTWVEDLPGVILRRIEDRFIGSPFDDLDRFPTRVEVDLVSPETVNFRQAVSLEVAQHLVEGTVLHHYDDKVPNLMQPR
jgi:hypothetical protein